MNKIWNELSEQSKDRIRQEYDSLQRLDKKERIYELELLFGKENLSPKPKIKTWEDLEKNIGIKLEYHHNVAGDKVVLNGFMTDIIVQEKVIKKVIATLKIAKLIELGYGGIVTNKEWKDDNNKYAIEFCNNELVKRVTRYWNTFITFHTKEQRDEFFEHNEQLCKDYYMID